MSSIGSPAEGLERWLVVFLSGICLVLKPRSYSRLPLPQKQQFECVRSACQHSLCCENLQSEGKEFFPQPIVSILCHTVEHDHQLCVATEWHPSHGLHICHYGHLPLSPFNEKTEALPKGSRNTSLHEQMLTWSLAHVAFTACAVQPTNVHSDFSRIPKIPHMKKNRGKEEMD